MPETPMAIVTAKSSMHYDSDYLGRSLAQKLARNALHCQQQSCAWHECAADSLLAMWSARLQRRKDLIVISELSSGIPKDASGRHTPTRPGVCEGRNYSPSRMESDKQDLRSAIGSTLQSLASASISQGCIAQDNPSKYVAGTPNTGEKHKFPSALVISQLKCPAKLVDI